MMEQAMAEISSEDFLRALGLAFKEVRTEKGLTQKELAEAAGKTQSAVTKIEAKPARDMAIRVLYEMCVAGELSLTEIVKRAEKKSGSFLEQSGKDKDANPDWRKIEQVVQAQSHERQCEMAKIVWGIIRLPIK